MSTTLLPVEDAVDVFQQSDGYLTHARRWGKPQGGDVILLLHGGVSHSQWQAPLADAVRQLAPDLAFVAVDRRGSGLNQNTRGHLPSKEREIADVTALIKHLADSYERIHLAGWCFGAQVACIAAAELMADTKVESLLMISPGFVFGERYADVLRMSTAAVRGTVAALGISPDPEHAYVPVPLQPSDFTTDEKWLSFATGDELTLRRVTDSTVTVWGELAAWSWEALDQMGSLPTLAVFGTEDRLVDHIAVADLLRERLTKTPPVIEFIDAPHAVQFTEPDLLAQHLVSFVHTLTAR